MDKKYYLTPVEYTGTKDKWGNRVIKCICDCGNEVLIGVTFFLSGRKKSCGCYPVGRVKDPNAVRRHYLYRTWVSMRNRCYNPKTLSYKNYGGRGISVSDDWNSNFLSFIRDMGDRPEGDYSVDRKDNDGNYCKENCKWSTRSEQAFNRRKI